MGLYKNTNGNLDLLAGGTLYADAPVGSIQAYGGSSAPFGWLLCQGQAVSRATYAELFNVIGTSFGSGDGSTTFNVPDLRGKTLVGYNSSETEFNALGKTGGEKSHTLTTEEMPSHSHTQQPHSHSVKYNNGSVAGWPINYNVTQNTCSTWGPATTSVTAINNNTGGDEAHNNLQPYSTVNFIIKATTIALPSDFEDAVDEKIKEVTTPNLTALTAVTKNIANAQTYLNQNIFTIPADAKRVFFSMAGSGNIGGYVELVKGIQGYARDFNNISEALVSWTNNNVVNISYIYNHTGAAKDIVFQCQYLA